MADMQEWWDLPDMELDQVVPHTPEIVHPYPPPYLYAEVPLSPIVYGPGDDESDDESDGYSGGPLDYDGDDEDESEDEDPEEDPEEGSDIMEEVPAEIEAEPMDAVPTMPSETPHFYRPTPDAPYRLRKRASTPTAETSLPKRARYSTLLQSWRTQEALPSMMEIGESSSSPSLIPLTGETADDTVPLLVARSSRLGLQIGSTYDELSLLRPFVEDNLVQVKSLGDSYAEMDHAMHHSYYRHGRAESGLEAHRARLSGLEYDRLLREEESQVAGLRTSIVEADVAYLQEQVNTLVDILHTHLTMG